MINIDDEGWGLRTTLKRALRASSIVPEQNLETLGECKAGAFAQLGDHR